MDDIAGLLIVMAPGLIAGICFLVSFRREPRQFRNAIYLLVFVLWMAMVLLARYGQEWMVLPILLFAILLPLACIVSLIANGIVVVRRLGRSPTTLLPFAMAAVLLFVPLSPALAALPLPFWFAELVSAIDLMAVWFCFTYVALALYAWLYRRFPKRLGYDYIIIHGAGLEGTEPSPLLAGRIDKALELWEAQGREGVLVPSGGQGADEEISEAEAMTRYLLARGVPAEAIMPEGRSTTTHENLVFSKELMDARSAGKPYRVALVTSDFHAYRCAEMAHQLSIGADAIGSKTSGWQWPAYFTREFLAVTKAHKQPYLVIAALYVLAVIVHLIG